MKNKVKIPILIVLVLFAVALPAFALSEFVGETAEEDVVSTIAMGSEQNYILREYEGFVAVFVDNDPDCPMTVTDIEISTLRELDRTLIQTGMKVKSHNRLMMILEDIGS